MTQVFADNKTASPLRRRLESRSDRSFLCPMHATLCGAGLSAGIAAGCLAMVVNAPTLALTRALLQGNTEILHGVIVREAGSRDGNGLLVEMRTTVGSVKPPGVVAASIDVTPVDVDALEDQCFLVEHLEGLWREFRVREVTLPPAHTPRKLVWLGDPTACGYREVPADWEARVRVVGSVLGMRVLIAKTPQEASSQTLHERADVTVRLRGGRPWEGVEQRIEELGQDVLPVGVVGSSFPELLRSARELLLPCVLEVEGSSAARPLVPGEIVYHRKIHGGGRFDRFDNGSSKPCPHGENSFITWNAADKAAKGMARRYTNFYDRDVQLLHCEKYPNCGVYAVRRRDERE
ncbi:hypothetical protein [Nonomuraea insulae]|uniref:Uncharacterized protein n=1 Tax=Nonomuraea insulae TaxID=1616787 RepID=A0ABW1CRU2_9ACTN